jgi:hypothetical protein
MAGDKSAYGKSLNQRNKSNDKSASANQALSGVTRFVNAEEATSTFLFGSAMDFPMDWMINNAEDYSTAGPGYQGEVTVELLAQLRNTGRILDGFRFALDGASPLEASIDVRNIIPADLYSGWKLTQQFWARDIVIRRNMTTSAWTSVTDSIASRDCDVTDESGAGVSTGQFMRSIAELPGNGPTNGSTRWAVVIGEDGFLKLQWQALPLPASILNGKAIFKR